MQLYEKLTSAQRLSVQWMSTPALAQGCALQQLTAQDVLGSSINYCLHLCNLHCVAAIVATSAITRKKAGLPAACVGAATLYLLQNHNCFFLPT